MDGITAKNQVGATLVRGAIVVQHVFDDSVFHDLAGINSSGIGVQVIDACCGTSFYNLLADGSSGAGAKPLVIGNTGVGGSVDSGGVVGVGFFGASITHPGTGQNNISFASTSLTENINFHALYMEPNATDTVTPLIQIPANVHSINIRGGQAANNVGGSNAYMVDIATWAGVCGCVFDGLKNQTLKLVNDHINSITVSGNAAFGQGAGYTSGPYQMSSLAIGAGSAVTSTGAGGTMTGTIANGTAAMTTAAITAGNCGTTVTVAASGVATTDTITWAFSAAPAGSNAGLVAWPTTNNVNFAYCPNSAETPAAATINWRAVR
jgi:hypothetical protein